ncbi:MAG: hypothetical protein H6509_06330 [Bryobacterales bacterium]|nr:hypothetical protein [Acidobacteriota bacterium]MCB9384213.1 hypothetical protein [Bryobacterales bacterium]
MVAEALAGGVTCPGVREVPRLSGISSRLSPKEENMCSQNRVRIVFASDCDENFLLAEIQVGGFPCCQVLKREERGPVMVAFFNPDAREQILVDPDSFLAAVSKAVKEIESLKQSV